MFDLCFDLTHYVPFLEKIIYRVSRDFISEMVTVVEFRHLIGGVFDEAGRMISLAEEFAIFKSVENKLQ